MKTAPKKAKNNSKKRVTRTRTGKTWQERLFDQGIFREKPISLEYLKGVGDRFIEWCIKMREQEDLRSDKQPCLIT